MNNLLKKNEQIKKKYDGWPNLRIAMNLIYTSQEFQLFLSTPSAFFFYLKIWLQQLAIFQILFSFRDLNDHWSTAIEKINLCIVYNIFILFYLYLTVYKKKF